MRKFTILLILLVDICCTRQPINEKKIDNLIRKYNIDVNLNEKPIIIIPLYGCGSCVEKAIDFMNVNYKLQKHVFVLSAFYEKEYNIKIGHKIIFPNIIYDTLNYSGILELVLNTPVAFIKKDTLCLIPLQDLPDYDKLMRLVNSKNNF